MKKNIYPLALALTLGIFSCQSDEIQNDMQLEEFIDGHQVVYSDLKFDPLPINFADNSARLNSDFPSEMVLVSASYVTSPESNEMGRTVFFTDRGNKQLDFDWVPNLRFLGETEISDISYYIDRVRPASPSGLSIDETDAAIESAISTWQNASCSEMGLNRVSNFPDAIGAVAAIRGFGGIAAYVADINHAGWMPGAFFDFLAPGGSGFILGVTFTFAFRDSDGNFVDTNSDGKFDVALREIYYNNNFPWGIGSRIDVETVALHETGHGLSQAHFGSAFRKANFGIQFNPRAVMNATYSGVQRDLAGTDLAGHCSIWGNWPNK